MEIYFAPLKGLTDAHFRSFYFSHFSGFDYAVAPFLLSSEDDTVKAARGGSPAGPELIPQLLDNDAARLSRFAAYLKDQGFTRFNLNLGCPARVALKKSKGSALLAEPERLLSLLKALARESPLPFSVKTRLGYSRRDELLPQLERWKPFVTEDLIIHGRSALQGYDGRADWENVKRCARAWERPVIYNGDIRAPGDGEKLAEEMGPLVKGVMIGRGIFHNPFIGEEMRRGSLDGRTKAERFLAFHEDLAEEMGSRPKSFARLKGLWTYFSRFAGLTPEELDDLKHMTDPREFRIRVGRIIQRNFQL